MSIIFVYNSISLLIEEKEKKKRINSKAINYLVNKKSDDGIDKEKLRLLSFDI